MTPVALPSVDMPSVDMGVEIAGLKLPTPLIAASGTFGYGDEYQQVADYDCIGAISVKGLYLEPRKGCPPPRIWETPSGMLNAIGLQEVGIRRFLAEKLPVVRALGKIVIANICGSSLAEYGELARILDQAEGVAGIEVNISCPNVAEGGIEFGCDPDMAARATEVVRRGDSTAGDSETQSQRQRPGRGGSPGCGGRSRCGVPHQHHPRDGSGCGDAPAAARQRSGGLSGPAIRPIAVRMVWEVARGSRLPVIGIGGIANAEDALEFLLVGAAAVQIGTMNFVDPGVWRRTLDGLAAYCRRHEVPAVRTLTGAMLPAAGSRA